jgi:hypothetical protein
VGLVLDFVADFVVYFFLIDDFWPDVDIDFGADLTENILADFVADLVTDFLVDLVADLVADFLVDFGADLVADFVVILDGCKESVVICFDKFSPTF